jgi:hypothetical protein
MRVKAKGHYLYVQPKPKADFVNALVIESPKMKTELTLGKARAYLNKSQYKYSLPDGITAKDLKAFYIEK